MSKTADKKQRKRQIRLLYDLASLHRRKAVECCGLALAYEQVALHLQSGTTESFDEWRKNQQSAWDEHVMVPLAWIRPKEKT